MAVILHNQRLFPHLHGQNPFTAKCGQRLIPTRFTNFIFENFEKQIASRESTDRELSFEWSHHRISSTDSKVRVTLQNSIKHSGSERVNKTVFSIFNRYTQFNHFCLKLDDWIL